MRLARARVITLALGLLLAPHAAEAQQPAGMPRIGILGAAPGPQWETLRQQLRDLGYVEGKNVAIEHRWAKGKNDLLPDLAAELVRIGVKVIVTEGTPAARAAKKTTSTIPVVMGIIADPVGAGLVESLARPGGNVTGFTSMGPDLVTKQAELLKETVPGLIRIAALWNPDNPVPSRLMLERIGSAAPALRVQIQVVEARGPGEFDSAFSTMTRERANALLVVPDPTFDAQQKALAEWAAKSRLPAIYNKSLFAERGGLLAYGAHYLDNFRQAAIYVDRILKGAKPADLPVQQPTRFELVINLKTANALGLTIPPSVLFRADHVIQ